nr:MAG TPA: hypothetical protein [Caudoviricetes sp.]DAO74735.1 MAG TPA: hypothetical protein [Caudoviricetes sp.]
MSDMITSLPCRSCCPASQKCLATYGLPVSKM